MPTDNAASDAQAGLRMEYTALREEIVKRIELRAQILFGSLTVAGVLLGFSSSTPLGVLVYPIIAAFLAAAWSQNDIRIKQLSKYVREHIEDKVPGLAWEQHRLTTGRQMTRLGRIKRTEA
jgi:hypothetical protein